MRESVARVVDPFLTEADKALGQGYSAVLYGSAARGDFVPGRSNINLMLVMDQLTPSTLRSLSRAFAGWRKATTEPPLLLSRAEWTRATDAFPIEITDMRTSYRLLRGADPFEGIRVDPTDLRKALEREFRGKLLRLRQGYTLHAPDPAALGKLGLQSAAAAAAIGFEGEHLLHVVRHRVDREWRCQAPEFENYMKAVEDSARYVDQLQLGDQQ